MESSESRKGKVAVVGAGNLLMRDEGVGVHVIRTLQSRGVPPNVEVFDAGVAAMDVLDDLSDFDRIIIVDATRGGEEPGAIYRYRPEDLDMESFGKGRLATAHGTSLVESLVLNRLAGNLPEDIVLIGVEPAKIEVGMELSEVIEGRMDTIIRVLMKEIS